MKNSTMTPRDIALRSEKLRETLAALHVPALYASRIKPLKDMWNDMLVLQRELGWLLEDALKRIAELEKRTESNP